MRQIIMKGIEQIVYLIKGRRFLLVRDSAYDYLKVKNIFDRIPHIEFSGFTSNPLYEQVCEGVKLFNKEQCELIVAIGGGSAIDVAKCIKLYCKMESSTNYLKQETFDSGITLIAVPTTAGTGSESTHYAVIYYEGKKQSISHVSLIPNYAVLEPSVLKTLPEYQKKCTLLDALCQAIESWWSVNSNDESKEYSRRAIGGIIENWEKYIFENTESAAEKIMEAANYAGRAIDITSTTAPHAMSYEITSLYQFSHGHAVAVCMPEVWNYMLNHIDKCIDRRGKMYLKNTMSEISEMISLYEFRSLLNKMKIEYPKATNRDIELEILTQTVNPVRLKNNPIALSPDILKDMYRRIIK